MLPELLGQERKFTFKWESREVFLEKDIVKLDLKNGFNLDTGSRRWKKLVSDGVCRTLLKASEDPGFPKASCRVSSETLPTACLPAPVLTLSQLEH